MSEQDSTNTPEPSSKKNSLILRIFKGAHLLWQQLSKLQKGLIIGCFTALLMVFFALMLTNQTSDPESHGGKSPDAQEGAAQNATSTPLNLKKDAVLNKNASENTFLKPFLDKESSSSTSFESTTEKNFQETLNRLVSTDVRSAPFPSHRLNDLARPFRNPRQKPVVVVIVSDLGYVPSHLHKTLSMPPEVTVSLYVSSESPNHMRLSHESGHETLLQIPMEPMDYPESDPGENLLLTGLAPLENKQRLMKHLQAHDLVIGVASFMGGRFTISHKDMVPFLANLKSMGLMFLDFHSHALSVTKKAGSFVGLPVAKVRHVLDVDEKNPTAFFETVEKEAQKNAITLVQVPAGTHSLEALETWLQSLASKDILLAPVSLISRKGL